MFRIVRVPLAVLLLLIIAVISCSVGQPLRDDKYFISGNKDDLSSSSSSSSLSSIHASEVHDLLSAGNSPKTSVNGKKHMKNSAGKSDEGGFYKTYGSDAEGEKGYLKQSYSKGDHGYKTLDTFHKKDGDNYGFEEHTAFGKARGRNKGGKAGKSGSYTTKGNDAGDHEGAGTIVDAHYAEEDGDKVAAADGEGAESGESTYYEDGGDGDEHYSSDGDTGEYTEGDSDGGNYGNSDGYNEEYSSGGGDEGSYGSSSSYSNDGEGGGEYY